jgi:hypothetical protein
VLRHEGAGQEDYEEEIGFRNVVHAAGAQRADAIILEDSAVDRGGTERLTDRKLGRF